MRSVLVLLGLVAIGSAFLSGETREAVPIPAAVPVAEAGKPQTVGNGFGELVLERQADGHFYLDAQVGAATVRFLVDTGASVVALSESDAQAAGLHFAPADFSTTAQGAGGAVAVKPVVLDRVAAGAFEATAVQAIILSGGNQSLLGQNWLQRVGTVTIEGDRMRLR